MNILQKYLIKSYVSAFLLGMIVLTFVLSIGLLVKATQLVIKGLDPKLILNFLVVSIPESFSFTIPLAVLVSALLVFGRLSTDGEISAMKACGVNIWNVMVPLICFGVFLTGLSIMINSYVAPKGYYARHVISSSVQGTSALSLLEPGHFIEEFPGVTFWFAEKDGDMLYNVLIYDKSNPNVTREIRADKALVIADDNDITLDMTNVRIDPFSETEPGAATAGRLVHTIKNMVTEKRYVPKVGGFLNEELGVGIDSIANKISALDVFLSDRTEGSEETLTHAFADVAIADQIDPIYGGLFGAETFSEMTNDARRISAADTVIVRKQAELESTLSTVESVEGSAAGAQGATVEELKQNADRISKRIADVGRKQAGPLENMTGIRSGLVRRRSELMTELNRRFALGVTPIVFLLIGMPLGMKTSRKESNIGVAISIGTMIFYYALMILTKGQAKNAAIFPHLIIWFAPAVCILTAIVLIRRNR